MGLTVFLEQLVRKRLQSYEAEPGLLREHYGIEETVLAGGYGYRQILELVQNGADAILEAHEAGERPPTENRIKVILRGQTLYVANTGAPLSTDGLDALLRSHSSPKRGNQIGRFGLGFKSLLRLGGTIDVLTKSGEAIRFDPQRCRSELRSRFEIQNAPALRLAWPLAWEECAKDSIVDTELDWAETVIRGSVVDAAVLAHLASEITTFPAEFLLFFPIATQLELDVNGKARALRVESEAGEQLLHDGEILTRWRVLRKQVHIRARPALDDATHIHARETVPLAWAVPRGTRREESGRFWAFFPTGTPTYIPGILNAPWKLNSDRNAIIGGEWNAALMSEAAALIVDALPGLTAADDPAQHLDLFPRQLERKDDVASALTEAVWDALCSRPVIPDCTGVLRRAQDLWRHPRDSHGLVMLWTDLATPHQAKNYCHPACLERQRASRLTVLAERIQSAGAPYTDKPLLARRQAADWFDVIASGQTDVAMNVLLLAEAFAKECRQQEWDAVRGTLAIVPVEGGGTVRAGSAVLCPEGTSVPGRQRVLKAVAEDARQRVILSEVMQVGAPSVEMWRLSLGELLKAVCYGGKFAADAWRTLWERLRQVPESIAREFIAGTPGIRVLRMDGEWVEPACALLPGTLVRADETGRSRKMLLDSAFHAADAKHLGLLKLSDTVAGDLSPRVAKDALPSEWLTHWRHQYKGTYKNSASWDYLTVLAPNLPAGMQFLPLLEGMACARLTELLLRRLAEPGMQTVKFGHRTSTTYPTLSAPHPLLHALLQYGQVDIGGQAVPLLALVARRSFAVVQGLRSWAMVSQVMEQLAGAATSAREPTPTELAALWAAATLEVWSKAVDPRSGLPDLWIAAASDQYVPPTLTHLDREYSISEVYVTSSLDLLQHAAKADHLSIVVPEIALPMWVAAGARNLNKVVKVRWTAASGPDVHLTTAFPELVDVLRAETRDSARCRPVSELVLEIHGASVSVPCVFWDGEFVFDSSHLQRLHAKVRTAAVLNEISQAGWLASTPQDAAQTLDLGRAEKLCEEVRRCTSAAEKLVHVAGGRRDRLLELLGDHAQLQDLRDATEVQIASAALAYHGPAVLWLLAPVLEEAGLRPPKRWNTQEARVFVESIGFPPEFATSPASKREPEEFVSGPVRLPPLHDFQQEVYEGLAKLWTSSSPRRRAVVSLPTGGGKTRVTVEAAVRLVLAPTGTRRCVIWIAQTDELCEQAVQAFRQVWVNAGAENVGLRIVRLWGGNRSPVLQQLDRPVAVVASIQTLNSRMASEGLAWLRNCAWIVMDECHHAITTSYTNVLRWLDILNRPTKEQVPEPVVVGLSATPFRVDEDESARLARRFDSRWLPREQEQLHARLQRQGVLARIAYEPIESGAKLLEEEAQQLASLSGPWEGIEFENLLERINRRLGADQQRNRVLLRFLRDCNARSVLFFANTVRHAEEMAIRLNLAGVSAAAVSGGTPPAARRFFLEQFQSGEIRVLCNQSVLTTGFDAPRTEMVLIARQVFSPVQFMQMVGRGLRGERNGGTSECRLVTVRDNLGRFQDKHPYEFCRRYFESELGQ